MKWHPRSVTMSSFSKLHIDLRQMILALETMVDLVGMNDTNHAKRVGYIAAQIGHKLGFSTQDTHFVFELGLLHDCGVSTEQMHSNLVNHFDWEDAHIHCKIGYNLLKGFEPLSRFAIPILHHHTPWEQLKEQELTPFEKRMANLIFLSDRIDVMAAPHYKSDILLAKEDIVKSIKHYSGEYFDPVLVEAFLKAELSEAFWIALEERHISRYTWDMGQFEAKTTISIEQLKGLAMIMAYIVDQKSPFTAQHSARVSALARHLATEYGLSTEQCAKIEIAGLLHDIGKLRTPDAILDKPGPLDDIERAIINQHSYETYEILRHIKGLEEIAKWAAYHHEEIDGSGYPFHPSREELGPESRIIAIADVFQALVQDRPYRDGMDEKEVLTILDQFVLQGKLDPDITEIVKKDLHHYYEIASGLSFQNSDTEIPLYDLEEFSLFLSDIPL